MMHQSWQSQHLSESGIRSQKHGYKRYCDCSFHTANIGIFCGWPGGFGLEAVMAIQIHALRMSVVKCLGRLSRVYRFGDK